MLFRFSDCEVDAGSGELRRQGALVSIQAKPFLLLVYLLRNRDRLVEYEEILNELWHGTFVGDAAPRRAMKDVRRAIGDDGVAQRLLRTIRGRGYRFVGDVRVEEHDDPDTPLWISDPQSGRFIGRDRLMMSVDAALTRLRSGCGGLFLLTGEAGIGKTRALSEISHYANARQIEVHRGVCVEREGTPSFWPWSQILRSVFASRGRERAHALAGAAIADLADIDPGLVAGGHHIEAVSPIVGADTNFRLRESVSRLLVALALERPMVIELDDLHWADLGSLRLLIHLARALPAAPLLLIGTFRDFEARLDPRRLVLLGELERLMPGATTELSALDLDEIEALVTERITGKSSSELLHKLLEQSGGNPFLLNQLAGLIHNRAGRLELDALADHHSAGRIEAILLHAAKLSAETFEVLRLAAVIGRRFTQGLLFLSLETDVSTLSRALSEAQSAGLIREDPKRVKSYYFVHSLVAEALCDSNSSLWTAQAHATVGMALEQLADSMLGSRDAELAHHYLEAGPGYEEKAFTYQRRAGKRADERASSDEAVMHYERAVQILEGLASHQETLCETLIELGDSRTRASDTVGGRESFYAAAKLARRLNRPELFSRAAVSYSNEIAIGGFEPESIELLEEALHWVRTAKVHEGRSEGAQGEPSAGIESRIQSRLAYARYNLATPEQRADRAAEAVDIAIRSADMRTHALALKDYHDCLMGAASAHVRAPVADELANLGRLLGDREVSAWSEQFHIEDALELGESDLVDHHCDMHEAIANELRHPLLRCHSLHYRAMRMHRAGRLADAENSAEEGLALGLRSGNQIALQFYGVQIWSLRRDQGRLEEIEPQVLQLIQGFPENSGWRAALAYDYMERGDRMGAATHLAQLVDRERESIRSSVNWTTTPALLSEIAYRLGDEARARRLYDDLVPHRAGHVIVSHSMADFGPVDRYLGFCAATFDEELAIRHFRSALRACETARVLPMAAAIRVDLSQILIDRDRDTAIDLAGRARAEAVAIGLPRIARAADDLIASS